jgi:hypothetical protein
MRRVVNKQPLFSYVTVMVVGMCDRLVTLDLLSLNDLFVKQVEHYPLFGGGRGGLCPVHEDLNRA